MQFFQTKETIHYIFCGCKCILFACTLYASIIYEIMSTGRKQGFYTCTYVPVNPCPSESLPAYMYMYVHVLIIYIDGRF